MFGRPTTTYVKLLASVCRYVPVPVAGVVAKGLGYRSRCHAELAVSRARPVQDVETGDDGRGDHGRPARGIVIISSMLFWCRPFNSSVYTYTLRASRDEPLMRRTVYTNALSIERGCCWLPCCGGITVFRMQAHFGYHNRRAVR